MVTGVGSGVYRTIQLVRQATGQEVGIYLEGNELVVSLPRRMTRVKDLARVRSILADRLAGKKPGKGAGQTESVIHGDQSRAAV